MKTSWRRRLTYGSNATLVTGMVIVVLGLLYVLADVYRVRWDLSAEAANTLSADTLTKLRVLDAEGLPVEISAFTANAGRDESYFKDRSVKDLLTELDHHSQVITWRQVDFDKERLTAEQLGVTQYGHIVVQRGDDRVDIKERELFRRGGKGSDRKWEFLGESALNRALAQLLSPRRRVVYVLQGHGELDPDERGPDGLSSLASALDLERFEVAPLDLLRTGRDGEAPSIPEDAALLFIARPLGELTPPEEDLVLAHLGRGKPLLIAMDIGTPPPALLGRMGITLPEGMALDRELLFPYRDRPLPLSKRHAITEQLRDENLTTVLAGPAPVVVMNPPPTGVHAETVLTTSRDGWIERGGELEGGMAVYEPGIDGEGPVDMAVALELLPSSGFVRAGKPAARVLVVGDSDVFMNALIDEGPGNSAFAVNAIQWLAGEDDRLGAGTVRAVRTERRLALTKEEVGTLRWLSLGVMPGLVLLAGAGAWLSRRGR